MNIYSAKKGFIPTFIVVLLALTLLGVISFLYINSFKSKLPAKKTTVASSETKNKPYKSGEEINGFNFYLVVPSGWIVNYRQNWDSSGKLLNSFGFDYAPPNWKIPENYGPDYMGWGGYNVSIFPYAKSIDDFVSTRYGEDSNFEVVKQEAIISNGQHGYTLSFNMKDNPNFGVSPSYVYLGSKYSYIVSWGAQQSAVMDYSIYDKMEKPYFVFR